MRNPDRFAERVSENHENLLEGFPRMGAIPMQNGAAQ